MGSLDSAVDLLHLFGDATRVRLLALLGREELSVAELTGILELPQSRISTHLGKLKEAGLLRDRKIGASTRYALNDGAMPESARRVWDLLQHQIDDRVIDADRRRSTELRRARALAVSWPESIAGEMERHYSPGRTWEATARGLLGFIRAGRVLDVGAGDGAIAALLAPRAESYTLLDKSERMIEAARRRLASQCNVQFKVADMLELPFGDASFDQALLFNTLQYAETPGRALGEAARVLAPGGTIALVTLAAHEHADVTGAYGHVQNGFSPRLLRRLLEQAGLVVEECAVTSREKRKPYFEIVTAFGKKRYANAKKARPNGGALRHNARAPANGADARGKRR